VQLDINGEIVADPTQADISRAIDAASRRTAWYLTITRPDGFYLEVTPSDVGSSDMLGMTCGNDEKDQRQFADTPVNPAQAKAILTDFFNGGDAWRRQCKWYGRKERATDPVLTGRQALSRNVQKWIAFIFMGAVGLVALGVTPWVLALAAVLAIGVIAVDKAGREARARRWPQTPGRITKSALQARRTKFQREATRVDNIPAVEYEFTVAGRSYVGTRINLNTEYALVDVGAMVAKYPVGAVVMVHYNPADPVDCILDPDANRGILRNFLKLLLVIAGFAAAIYYGASAATHWVAARFPAANAPHAVLAGGFGLLFLLLLMWSFRSRVAAARAPGVTGRIVTSEVEEVGGTSATAVSRTYGTSYYQPTIEVAYRVRGADYLLRSKVGGDVLTASPDRARAVLAAYPVGRDIAVTYNAKYPGSASCEGGPKLITMEPTIGYRLLALAISAACFAMAARALGVL
jgi:hypothetical protein